MLSFYTPAPSLPTGRESTERGGAPARSVSFPPASLDARTLSYRDSKQAPRSDYAGPQRPRAPREHQARLGIEQR